MDDGIHRRESKMLQFGLFVDPLPAHCSVFDRSTRQTHMQVDMLHASVAFKQELGHDTLQIWYLAKYLRGF